MDPYAVKPESIQDISLIEEIIDRKLEEKIEKPKDLYPLIKKMVASFLGLEEERVRTDRHLFEIGFDSLSALSLVNQLQKDFSI